ncbi:MAG TPA: metal-dependent transcriptional regulator [Candidatus Bathyarchaeota archaeon]|nr:metal-dependent transcriptional regulator [Candidatus Bathyarchaeota archaeon]
MKLLNAEAETVSSQAEEYLEAIYRLEQKGGFARTMELAKSLNVVPGSVTNTIENLKRKGLVTHRPYKGVKLTDNGRKIASSVLRRHRLAERLLTDVLHLDWSEVHDQACKLEHALSPEILKPLEKALGHPKRCPHGNPIPTSCGGIFEEETVALSKLDAKTGGVIVKITEEKTETLQQLTRLNLTPGKRVQVENIVPSGSLTIRVEGESCTIDQDLASIIYVKTNGGEVRD